MPLEFASGSVRPNRNFSHDFDGDIAKVAVGIRGFNLSYGAGVDHDVQTLSVLLTSSYSGKQLSVEVHAALNDSSGHTLDVHGSSVDVVAIAWTGVDDPSLTLANEYDIESGGSSPPIAVACTAPLVRTAVLSGFDLSYGAADHYLRTLEAGVGTSQSGSQVKLSGSAQMYDGTGHRASVASVDGGLLAHCDPTLPMQILSTGDMQNLARDKRIEFGSKSIDTYQIMLTGFRMQYPGGNDDHEVTTVGASVSLGDTGPGFAEVNGATWLNDDSGHRQDDAISHVSAVVIGYAG
ncbi:hypothetical protein J5226_17405 [Lysobacter sp. K5869]|uniref:hypothetical protein n=1 Tax=Lysobacter sp. K5869 TaxID=2820808 RepID=UPI001C061FA7|nr:hypothetical protein [Lysobacter sp. K5869]QWP75387.1 hypothetical protein J5226_17405 [Lysobacter sp. K5869]